MKRFSRSKYDFKSRHDLIHSISTRTVPVRFVGRRSNAQRRRAHRPGDLLGELNGTLMQTKNN